MQLARLGFYFFQKLKGDLRMRRNAFTAALLLLTPCLFLSPILADDELEEKKQQKLSRSIADFSFALNQQFTEGSSDNTLFSPYSLFSSLSLLYAGARTDTAAQIAKALSLQIDAKDLYLQMAKLQKKLKAPKQEGSFTLRIANALWLDRDSYILSDFRHIAEVQYEAKVESVNFAEEERSRSIVNEWTSNQTDGKIINLLQMGDISSSTRLLITNALFFEGTWQKPFDPKNTKAFPFNPTSDDSTTMMMMEQTGFFPYYETEGLQILSLPFKTLTANANIACLILLPEKTRSLASLASSLSSFEFTQWIEGLDNRNVHMRIPKFTITTRNDLNDPLQQMGMQIPFTSKANFSGINGMQDLYLSKVIHQAYFLIDEKGACASAASAAALNLKSTGPSKETPFEFIVDRPFLFALVEINTGSILFLGSFSTPITGNSP